MKKYIVSTLVIFFIGFFNSIAKDNIPNPNNSNTDSYRLLSSGCLPSTAQTIMDVNNVRTTILGGGDMWWDLDNAKYEIPRGSDRHSMFAGALWIGGLDAQGNLKVAGMTYRQDGNDFWPGPLNSDVTDPDYGTIDPQTCAEFDKHYKIELSEVLEYIGYFNCIAPDCIKDEEYPDYVIPDVISKWPAERFEIDGTFDYLAPYVDLNGNMEYDPTLGEYPAYDVNKEKDCKNEDILFGDQTLWWVFNDNGNIHTESGSESAIGLEIQAQGFGFQTNDEINNMTFYNYKIINRSTQTLNDTYFGQWVDPDLGEYQDDFVGCDVSLGLGYCYNGDAVDEGVAGYNYDSDDPPPAIGVDFFRGPLADGGDGIDNDRDGVIDEEGEQIIMSKFVYYNNDFTVHGNPENAQHYYGYLRGIWKNGQKMTYGQTGWEEGLPECNFMFPDDTDTENATLYGPWTEIIAGNTPADRRFLQSAGPFTLEPGAVNYITTGVVWARASEGNNFASVELMKIADKKAQTLFDICFEVIDGPSAPDMTFVELDQELIVNLTNSETSNNFGTSYAEEDEFISDVLLSTSEGFESQVTVDGVTYYGGDEIFSESLLNINKQYKFEGYQVFQLKNKDVSQTDLYNPDKAYLVYQCDVENYLTDDGEIVFIPSSNTTPIANLVNYSLDESVGPDVYMPQNMTLESANSGISHSFRITEDKFATGNPALVNNKEYYYMVIAYAYNEYIPYSPETPFSSADPFAPSNVGQKKPYLAGRKNIKTYTAIPHKIESFGDVPTGNYGDAPAQDGYAGRGNGGNFVEISAANRNEIATNYSTDVLNYRRNMSPLEVTVIDPLSVPDADFIFKIVADDTLFTVETGIGLPGNNPESNVVKNGRWSLTMMQNGAIIDTKYSNTFLSGESHQVIPEWGLAIRYRMIPDLQSGQREDLGCLSCGDIPPVSNAEIDKLFWDLDTLSMQELISIAQGADFKDALDDLWLSPMPDVEVWDTPGTDVVAFSRAADWIRSGSDSYSPSSPSSVPLYPYGDVSVDGAAIDPSAAVGSAKYEPLDKIEIYETEQFLVPYKLLNTDYRGRTFCSNGSTAGCADGPSSNDGSAFPSINVIDTIGGGLAWYKDKNYTNLNRLNNIDLVLTPDQSLWTRCPVLDLSESEVTWTGNFDAMTDNTAPNTIGQDSEGSPIFDWASGDELGLWEIGNGTGLNETAFKDGLPAEKWDLRLSPNVGKDGQPDNTGEGFNSENGWGWFPGYAVNVTTGRRLNLMFTENSSLGPEHNATDMKFNPTPYNFIDANGEGYASSVPWGAESAVMNGGHAVFVLDSDYQGDNHEDNPHFNRYCANGSETTSWNDLRKKFVIQHIQWVGYWLASDENTRWDTGMENEVVIRARVPESYGYRASSQQDNTYEIDPITGAVDTIIGQLNQGYPVYRFNSSEILTIIDDEETKKGAMDDINIVPNPYYGMSGYESSQVDTRVKITNLPKTCRISIYTINGNRVRQYNKDNGDSYLEWDLKNEYGIQIASGMYLIHIDAGAIGERTLKWFGAMRPIDLNTF